VARSAARSEARQRRSSSVARDGARPAFLARLAEEALGALGLASAAIATLSLATHDAKDPLLAWTHVHNAAGVLGANLAALLLGAVGPGAWVLVGVLAVVSARLLVARPPSTLSARFWLGASLLLLATATVAPLLHGVAPSRFDAAGGLVGSALASAERTLLSTWGGLLLNAVVLVAGALGVTGIPVATALAAVGQGASAAGRVALALARAAADVAAAGKAYGGRGMRAIQIWRERRARRDRVAELREPSTPEPGASAPVGEEALAATSVGREADGTALRGVRAKRGGEPAIVDHAEERKGKKSPPRQEAFVFADAPIGTPFRLPELELFDKPAAASRTYDRDSLIMNSRILEKKLRDFGVLGTVLRVHPGPVITMYEFEPASGVKVSRITNLSDDLSLALRALSVRIIAPIPGTSVVGIEVPNGEREMVWFRDVLESESFRASRSKLTLALGKDIFGNPVEADLARMPHLLVAGATGTGKSVFLNSLLCSLLFRATPDELKLLLIDPKLLELSIYEGIPHLIADVVTNPKRAAAALGGVVHKMEERYQMMSALGVRNIDQFNARVDEELAAGNATFRLKAKPGESEGREVAYARIPYIVVVIDELADLMVLAARDVEEALQRLAQMARAAGIHLVLATQRPSVDVLTGVIKANFPARISFQVSSRTDSRTILDQNGAEHLLGQGDMLFLPPGTSKLQRIHGAYVSEKEVSGLVRFLREQGAPQFDEALLRAKEETEAAEERGEEVDEMYDRAIAIVTETRNASISYLQRRLKVGYNRAARMIEQMELDGIVGPQDGPKGREVFARSLAEE
jgi:S-DNA-T family DNA segregation ATPase FtsK/SpoIIIE